MLLAANTTGRSPAAVSRNQALDVLRFFAILLVIGRHLPALDREAHPLLLNLAGVWTRGGWVGVDLFFVLSGFLVSGLLFGDHRSNGTLSIGRFYIRRGFKIYPAFFFFLFLTLPLFIRAGSGNLGTRLLAEATFFQNYFTGLWPHTWSLAVEEHFYFLLPVTLLALSSARKGLADPFRAVVPLTAVVCTGALALRILNAWAYAPERPPHWLSPTHLRIDSLLFGVCISYFYHFRRDALASFAQERSAILVGFGVVLLSPAFIFEIEQTAFLYTVGFTSMYLGSGALLVAAMHSRLLSHPVLRPLSYLGEHSYSIYLWHIAVIQLALPSAYGWAFEGAMPAALTMVTSVIASCLVGIVAAKLVESPFLHLRDRLFPSVSTKGSLAAAGANGGPSIPVAGVAID